MRIHRSPHNPILQPTDRWWETKAVFNPGVAVHEGRIALVYRAVGADGLSRFGLAWSDDGETIVERSELPWYEAEVDDPQARLGVEDPRISKLNDAYYLTYCKAAVEPAATPKLSWETAPFRIRTGLGLSDDFAGMKELSTVLPDRNTKDGVLFPERFNGRYAMLIREYPAIQLICSDDLRTWDQPVPVMAPIPATWEGERIGAGPPPLRTPWGWLLLYHGNEYLRMPANERLYRMGLAVLDAADPTRVIYRHPDPIFQPEAPYEMSGPVGNVVFVTGLAEREDRIYLYYGAGDGVIACAWIEKEKLYALLTDRLGRVQAG
jgi:predicted GH43/DUF377 family glycosyl hydrolase